MKLKKMIDELKPGMYVYELDRPWLDTPFPLQGFLVQSPEDVEALREHCEFVYIDPLREQIGDNTSRLRLKPLASLATGKGERAPIGAVSYANKRSVEEELPKALAVTNGATEVFNQIRSSIERNKAIDIKGAAMLVESLVDTIVANPDALMLILRLRKEAEPAYAHAMFVAANMLAFGRHLGLPKEELSVVGMAGLLLDVGMIKLPKELLEKKSPLSRAEHALIKRHVQYGEEMLRSSKGISERVVVILTEHHERENGSGYPRGVLSKDISVYGKMAAIVDCYRELAFGGSAGLQASSYDALEIMHGWGGKFFHPALLEQFIQCIGIYPAGSLVELNTGEVAIIVAHNRARRMRPRIMIILDPRKQAYPRPVAVDLANDPISNTGISHEIKRGLDPGMYGIDPKDYYL